MIRNSLMRVFAVMVMWLGLLAPQSMAHASDASIQAETLIQQFADQDEVSPQRRIDTHRKYEIMFWMGIALLVLLLITGGLGVAMAAFGKEVFVPHMILAGLSITLAIAHAVTAVVWFWPY